MCMCMAVRNNAIVQHREHIGGVCKQVELSGEHAVGVCVCVCVGLVLIIYIF